MTNLTGKVALVTGAGGMKGTGRAIALKLAAMGADIVISDLKRGVEDLHPNEVKANWKSIQSVAEEVRHAGRQCLEIWCDLSDSAQIQAMIRQTAERYGRLDILVNNARAIGGRDNATVTELSEDVWAHFLAVNTTAVFLTMKYAAPLMIERGEGGRIINIASTSGKRALPKQAAYSASKFAVIGLTQSAALDLARHQITVNAVCPGMTNTDRMNYYELEEAKAKGVSMNELRAKVLDEWTRLIPLGRVGESEDIANMVGFLASDEASFITGQAYNVNGGGGVMH